VPGKGLKVRSLHIVALLQLSGIPFVQKDIPKIDKHTWKLAQNKDGIFPVNGIGGEDNASKYAVDPEGLWNNCFFCFFTGYPLNNES
jgi:hypothetical protein